jgi:hypothetical protein
VFRSILKRAERDEEIDRNPIPLVAKPKQTRTARQDKRGHRHERRPELDRRRDATLVSVLAYSGPGPESEGLPLRSRERIFRPAAIAVGLPTDTIPRDLRGSFASLLIFEGLNVLEVAPELGHKPSTCLDIYGRLFEEFDPSQRRPAVDVIRETRMTRMAPRRKVPSSSAFPESPLSDSNRRPLPYHGSPPKPGRRRR